VFFLLVLIFIPHLKSGLRTKNENLKHNLNWYRTSLESVLSSNNMSDILTCIKSITLLSIKHDLFGRNIWGAKCKKNVISKNMSNLPLFSYIIHYLQTIFVFWINNP
jgi:hypothetical protein